MLFGAGVAIVSDCCQAGWSRQEGTTCLNKLGYKVSSKRFIYGPSQKGELTSPQVHMVNGGAVNGERTRRKRRGGEESACD